MKLLRAPRSKPSDNVSPNKFPPISPLLLRDTSNTTGNDTLYTPQLKEPTVPMSKLPPQQTLLPQQNIFYINSELIAYQVKEVEAVFKAPKLYDFLLPHVLGDQITDSTIMHRSFPKQADINRIIALINRKYLTTIHLPLALDICKLHTQIATLQRYLLVCWNEQHAQQS